MAELAILPRCSAAELRGRLLGRCRGKIRLSLSPPPGNAQKDTLNRNFAALGDNWALRRHVIIPAAIAKAGALLKLLEFMDSARERETSRTRERARRTFLLSDDAYGPLFRRPDESASSSRSCFNREDEWSLFTKQRSRRGNGRPARILAIFTDFNEKL